MALQKGRQEARGSRQTQTDVLHPFTSAGPARGAPSFNLHTLPHNHQQNRVKEPGSLLILPSVKAHPLQREAQLDFLDASEEREPGPRAVQLPPAPKALSLLGGQLVLVPPQRGTWDAAPGRFRPHSEAAHSPTPP